MHTAELVALQTEPCVLPVVEVDFLFAFERTGAFIQITQETSACAILRYHHLNGALHQAFQRQRADLCQMAQLPHIQLHGQSRACGPRFLPELQALGIINVQAHIRPQRRLQVQILCQLPQACVVYIQQIYTAGFRLL